MKASKRCRAVSLLLLFVMALVSCERYDDRDLWKEITDIKKELAGVKSELTTLQKVVQAQQEQKTIDDVEEIEGGYKINFSDKNSVTIKHGLNAPEIGVQLEEGVYYWTQGGRGKWLLDAEGNKVPVTGTDGHSPVIGVDEEGYWTLDGERLKGKNGSEVKAGVKVGDAFFQALRNESDQVVFVLTNGEEITIRKTGADIFAFEPAEGEWPYYVFDFGVKQILKLKTTNIAAIEVKDVPEGWKIQVNKQEGEVTVTPPRFKKGVSYSGGIISLMGLDRKGGTYIAGVEVVASIDFTDKQGTFVVCEGNMTTVNGTVVYYDKDNYEYLNVFENANNGLEIGNVVQDMYIANGRIYLMTQNGNRMGGAGRFVVCDARTMKMEYASALQFNSHLGVHAWPQHLVICNDTLGYVQWGSSDYEKTSGITRITRRNGGVHIGNHVEGTYGNFTTDGAIKTRLLYSRDKLYAAVGHGVVMIDPVSSTVVKRITREGQQAKGIVKGANGNIFVAFAGTFKGSQQWGTQFTSDPIILELDHDFNLVAEHQLPSQVSFPVATWSPAIGLCASFTKPHLYFYDTSEFISSTASRYNYETKKLEYQYMPVYNLHGTPVPIYGIMGVHPFTEQLWLGRSIEYIKSEIFVYDVSGEKAVEKKKYHYPTQRGASTAGVDFAYRFDPEYIAK